jgi:hypothetical protein
LDKELENSIQLTSEFIDETINEIKISENRVPKVNAKEYQNIKKRLDEDPPIHPDLLRQINTYTAKVQFVELHFEGANIESKKVTIPSDILPIRGKEFKRLLETKIKLFENPGSNKEFKLLEKIKNEIKDIREKFLVSIKARNKSILKKNTRTEFKDRIKAIDVKLDKWHQMLPQILNAEILRSKENIRKEALMFFQQNIPEHIEEMYYPANYTEAIKDYVEQILQTISFPNHKNLVKATNLKVNYYDLTWEDFYDNELLDELNSHGFMDKEEIVRIKEAFEIKK